MRRARVTLAAVTASALLSANVFGRESEQPAATAATPAAATQALETAPPTRALEPAPSTMAILKRRAWAPAVVGAACIVGGAAALITGEAQRARSGENTIATANVVGGTMLVGMGAAALGVAALMWLWPSQTPGYALVPVNGGALLSWVGRF